MEGNPYLAMVKALLEAVPKQPPGFRVGKVLAKSPLQVAYGDVVFDEEITGALGEYQVGDQVLLANVNGDDQEYILLGSIQEA